MFPAMFSFALPTALSNLIFSSATLLASLISLSAAFFSAIAFSSNKTNASFSISAFSLNKEFVFTNCSLLNPSICACIPAFSFCASINATWFSTDLLRLYWLAAAATTKSAFFSISFSCSFKTSPNSLFAAILSSILALSSSRICLSCSACLSNCSINPRLTAAAISAWLANLVIASAAL